MLFGSVKKGNFLFSNYQSIAIYFLRIGVLFLLFKLALARLHILLWRIGSLSLLRPIAIGLQRDPYRFSERWPSFLNRKGYKRNKSLTPPKFRGRNGGLEIETPGPEEYAEARATAPTQ